MQLSNAPSIHPRSRLRVSPRRSPRSRNWVIASDSCEFVRIDRNHGQLEGSQECCCFSSEIASSTNNGRKITMGGKRMRAVLALLMLCTWATAAMAEDE